MGVTESESDCCEIGAWAWVRARREAAKRHLVSTLDILDEVGAKLRDDKTRQAMERLLGVSAETWAEVMWGAAAPYREAWVPWDEAPAEAKAPVRAQASAVVQELRRRLLAS